MRTKTLLLTAALGAAGVTSALGQVYSVNAVGYVNTQLGIGFNLVANPLNTGGNTVKEVHPTAPDGTLLYTFTATGPNPGFVVNEYYGSTEGWQYPDATIPPGTGYFLRVGGPATVTYVGEVPQGELTTALVAGFNLVGSQVPQAGKLETDLKYVPAANDVVYVFSAQTQQYSLYTYDDGWLPPPGLPDGTQPELAVGQGIWIRRGAAGSWSRTFSVNE